MKWEQGTIEGGWEPQSTPTPKTETAFERVARQTEESRQKSFKLSHELARGEMPMFMTGGEIMKHYKPLEADKNPKPNNIWENESDSELWDRKLKEAKMTGEERYGKESFERDRQGAWRSMVGPTLAYQGIGPKTSLESVAKEKGAISGHVSVEATPLGQTPQVLGGHHRIALAAEQFKEHLLPVKYHYDLQEAKQDRDYR